MTNKILPFELAKPKKKQVVCECKNPNFEIDQYHRVVLCLVCKCYVDPYYALEFVSKCVAKGYNVKGKREEMLAIKEKVFDEMTLMSKGTPKK